MDDKGVVLVVGGGLVGPLCAIFMARRGYSVRVFECNDDLRLKEFVVGQTINLTLSKRGVDALIAAGLKHVVTLAVPIKSRVLHDFKGRSKTIPLDERASQCLYSVDKNYLNRVLLTEMEQYPNISLYFNRQLISVSLEEGEITLQNLKTVQTEMYHGDLIIGADGPFSTVRRFAEKTPGFQFTRSYLKQRVIKLFIPAEKSEALQPNSINMWPSIEETTMWALPNPDNSWTLTLLTPHILFEKFENPVVLENFMKSNYPSASFVDQEVLSSEYLNYESKTVIFINIRCNRYHAARKALIIGDAAHAIAPYYGEGMNAGFEDCLIFDKILNENEDDIGKSLEEFSLRRVKGAHAIVEIALSQYYIEIASSVTKQYYNLRRFFHELLSNIFPNLWIPVYERVTFSSTPYEKCDEYRRLQMKIVDILIWSTACLIIAAIWTYFYR